jgi:hypothetical protein
MAASLQEITQAAIALRRQQRLVLVRLLLDLKQPGATDEIERVWDEAIRARVNAVHEDRA